MEGKETTGRRHGTLPKIKIDGADFSPLPIRPGLAIGYARLASGSWHPGNLLSSWIRATASKSWDKISSSSDFNTPRSGAAIDLPVPVDIAPIEVPGFYTVCL
jgi:hypothetical protein